MEKNRHFKLIGCNHSRCLSWNLKAGEYTLGRHENCDLVLPDMSVSRNHAKIEWNGNDDSFRVIDLNSRNGTFLNQKRFSGEIEVKAGDKLAFGTAEFEVWAADVDGDSGYIEPPLSDSSEINLFKSLIMPVGEALRPGSSQAKARPSVIGAISEMARMLVLPGPKESILNRSLSLVARVVPAERLAILLKDQSELGVACTATLAPRGGDMGSFCLSRTIISDILANRNTVIINDIQNIPDLARQQSIVNLGMKSAAAVPLFDEGEILGILYVDSNNPAHRYDNESLYLLATFGNLIASRLLNYSLLEERERRRLMDAELERASSIQSKLLPPRMPEIQGYQMAAYQKQCQHVGGDFYDATRLPDGRVAFMIGDVSGKGLGAALLMTQILGAFRILYRTPGFDPARAVEAVSQEVCGHSEADHFATIFMGLLDSQKHTLEYVNAGHNPPLLVRASGEQEGLKATGIMVGAFEEVAWDKRTVAFESGDTLLMFTDGVTEATGKEGLYGEPRLRQGLVDIREFPPDEIIGAILKDISRFVEESPPFDDITLLGLKRTA